MLDCVKRPMTSGGAGWDALFCASGWVKEMDIVDVRWPSLSSVTVNMVGPLDVRRRKFNWRAIVSDWFCEGRVLLKCSLATARKQLVT